MNNKQWGNHGKSIEIQGRMLALGTDRTWINAASSAVSDTCYAVVCINDCVFSAIEDAGVDLAAGVLSGVTVPAGVVLYGQLTGMDLTSGVAECVAKA